MPRPPVTNQELADALGLSYTSAARLKRRGMPMPAVGEKLADWAARVRPWCEAMKRKPGRRPAGGAAGPDGDPDSLAAYVLRWRKARALREELELQRATRLVHSREDCERDAVRRLRDLLAAFSGLPDRCARLLFNAPSPEWIKEQLVRELRSCFADLQRTIGEQAPRVELEQLEP